MPSERDEMMVDLPLPLQDAIRSTKATFDVLELLGKGSFGAVYRVRRHSDQKELALKCESARCKKQILKHEVRVLIAAMKVNSPHMLQFEDRGKVRDRFVYIIMRLVGKNLWDLRAEQADRKFSVSTAMKAGEQTLAGIRDLHRAGYLHRDIKPPNFAIGREADNNLHTVYLLDFGLCRHFRTDVKDLRMPRERAAFRGTTRYASLGSLELKEQSRKDDVEAWWYMLVEFMIGNLPWKHCKGSERDAVMNFKVQLRQEKNLAKVLVNTPEKQLREIFYYVDTLEYASIPDYDYIYKQLQVACQSQNISELEPLCWDPLNPYKGPKWVTGLDFNPRGEAEP